MFHRRVLLSVGLTGALLASGCIDIAGLEAGDPCNPQNVCVEGLRCIAGTCQLPGSGTSWRQMDTARASTFRDVWGQNASDVYAVGSSGTLARFRGTSWEDVPTGSSSTFYAVRGHGNEVWIAGSGGKLLPFSPSSGQLGANAEVFDPQGKTLTGLTIYGLASAGGKLYAISSDSSSNTRVLQLATTARWDVIAEISGLSARAVLGIGNELFIAGSGASYVARFDVLQRKVVEQLVLPGGSNYAVHALWGKSAADLIVAGESLLLQRQGSSWAALAPTTGLDGKRTYYAIAGSGLDGELFLVGQSKYLGSYGSEPTGIESCAQGSCSYDAQVEPDGQGGWQPIGSSETLYAVFSDGAGFVVAAGTGGIFRRQP